jgi:hypothetical protein
MSVTVKIVKSELKRHLFPSHATFLYGGCSMNYEVKAKFPLYVTITVQSITHCSIKHNFIETCWGTGGIAPRILNPGTKWREMVRFTLRPLLFPENEAVPLYPLVRSLGGPQNLSGCGEENKNTPSLPLLRIELRLSSPQS